MNGVTPIHWLKSGLSWFSPKEGDPVRVDHRWLATAKQRGVIPDDNNYAWARSESLDRLLSDGTHEIVWQRDRLKLTRRRIVDSSDMVLLRKRARK